MKIKIIILLGIFIFVHNMAQAMESKEKLVGIDMSSSDAIKAKADLREKAIDALLASVNKTYDVPTSNAVKTAAPKNIDLTWLLAFLLIGVYILWFRPKEWRNLIERLTKTQTAHLSSSGHEKRKWWRHNLLPLKGNNIYIKLESPESRTRLGLIPTDIGYGGLSFECNRLKRLKGKLNLSIFMPGAIAPVETEGNVAWQRNSRNIFRRQVGISFIKPPEKDWARIHHYIEEQYAALKQ